jgi:uncharacterized protein
MAAPHIYHSAPTGPRRPLDPKAAIPFGTLRMTPQERDLITTLLDRLKSAATQQKDPDADALIRQAVAQQPDMPYYLVQTVLIQDLSLHNAQDRIADLERQLAEAKQGSGSGSFLGKLFGSSQSAPPPAPTAGPWTRGPQVAQPGGGYGQGGYAPQGGGYAPQGGGYAPQSGYAPQPGYGSPGVGMLGGSGGGGFLRSAAATAAGVAGGALLFQGISSMFGHGYANSLYGGGMSPGLGETVINNYYGDAGPGGGDYGGGVGGDYGGGGGGDYASDVGGDFGGGGDYSGGGDVGGDFGGGGDVSC